jgi:hypothetical protein
LKSLPLFSSIHLLLFSTNCICRELKQTSHCKCNYAKLRSLDFNWWSFFTEEGFVFKAFLQLLTVVTNSVLLIWLIVQQVNCIIMATLFMGRKCCYVLCLIFIFFLQRTNGVAVQVGGAVGWTNFDLATSGPPDYATWASTQSLTVGDTLGVEPQHHWFTLLLRTFSFVSESWFLCQTSWICQLHSHNC